MWKSFRQPAVQGHMAEERQINPLLRNKSGDRKQCRSCCLLACLVLESPRRAVVGSSIPGQRCCGKMEGPDVKTRRERQDLPAVF